MKEGREVFAYTGSDSRTQVPDVSREDLSCGLDTGNRGTPYQCQLLSCSAWNRPGPLNQWQRQGRGCTDLLRLAAAAISLTPFG